MKAKGKSVAAFKSTVVALFAALLLALALAPAGADAAKVDNPSPPNFKAEVTGGYLQFIGSTGTPLQLPLDFSTLDPPLPNPTLTGTVTTNSARYGVINIPQAGITFPPIPVDVADFSLTIRMLPVAAATGFIDPLSGRVDLNIPIRLKAEGAALGQNLGDNCYVGSTGNPINISTTTSNGTFPTTNPTPAQSTYVSDFVSDGGSFAGGWLAAQPYSDEAGVWPAAPAIVPGKPVGTTPKPLPSEIPYNPLTDYQTRAAGSWRGMNETLAAPAASGCGTGLLASVVNGQVNSAIGLPSVSGASTASLDFKFVSFADRTGDNAIVQKAVKSKFIAPGISATPWLNTQTPTAVSAQTVSINASSSYFKAGASPTAAYAFDFGSGTFGAATNNPVASFTAPTLAEGAQPVILPIRVRVTDTDGDQDITTRNLKVVPATDISVTSDATSVAGAGKFRAGSTGHVNFHVKNNSADDASSQSITFTAALPSGVSLTNLASPGSWTCNTTSSSISCTLPQAGLAGGQTADFDATVDVGTGAANPSTVTAAVVMAGDPQLNNNNKSLSVPVVKTDLSVDLNRTTSLVANGWTPYTIDVANLGDAQTVGGSTVNVDLPADFSYRVAGSGGTGWTCTTPVDNRHVVCQHAGEIPANTSAAQLTVVAKIDRTAAAGPSTVSASVSTQGDVDAFGGANSDSDTSDVAVVPDLTVDATATGTYNVGDPGQVSYTATNEAVVPVDGPTTINSTLPAGLTVASTSGSGWDCTNTTTGTSAVSCDYAATLAGGETTPALTVNMDVAQAAFPSVTIPATVVNDDDGFALNNDDSVDVVVKRLDVSIQKLAVKPFNVGIEGRYRLNVTNIGTSPTLGNITVVDDLPAGLKLKGVSGAGWDCSASAIGQQHVGCVFTSVLGPGVQAAPIEVRVDVLDAAAEAGTVINTATVDTIRDTRGVPADAAITDNNTSTVETTAVAVDLSMESHHAGNFRVGTDDVYSLTARNVGFFGTDPGEPVTVTDILPAGIVADTANIDISRPGWTCADAPDNTVVCTLPAPSPTTSALDPESAVTFDIPVHVTDAAADDSTNVALVSTARDSNPTLSPNNRSDDPTHVNRVDLKLTGEVSIAPRAGGISEISLTTENIGTAATYNPTVVTFPLFNGVSYRPTGSTTAGWTCTSPGAGTQISCTRSQIIAAGGTAPPLKLRTNVSSSAPNNGAAPATASTEGEPATRLDNNVVSLGFNLEKIDLTVTRSHDVTKSRAGKRSSSKIVVHNGGNTASTGTIRIDDPVSSAFTNVSASGTGWSCSAPGNDVLCTRTASLGAGQNAPDLTVSYDIPSDVSGTRNWTTTVSNPSDPYTGNNTATDAVQVIASADIEVGIDQPASMKVGESADVTYTVTNVGTETTSGSPSVKLKIGTSSGLDPVSITSNDSWDCSSVSASGPDAAYFDCTLSDGLDPGATSSLVGNFDVIPTNDSQTATLAIASTPGDINHSNDSASATSDLSGLDLSASVAVPSGGQQDLTAGVTSRRVVTVTNDGTSSTTSPISVKVPLPDGVQWDNTVSGSGGAGWACSLQVHNIICNRTANDPLTAGSSLPPLNIDLRPARSNVPEITVNYIAITQGDENASNDTATRVDNVLYFPTTTITSAPSSGTSKNASLSFDSDDDAATFACKVDTGAFAPCTSPLTLSNLGLGVHTVLVQASNSHNMTDATPASATWTVRAPDFTGPSVPIKATLTGGSLSLASLGEVALPANQITLTGKRYTDSGGWQVPLAGVNFAPIEQVVAAPGLGDVTVKISISATDDGSGLLTNGGGAAAFSVPVQAKLEASLLGIPVIGPEADCYVKPIQFDLSGTYNPGGKTVTVGSNAVGFPTVSAGCGSLGGTVNTLIGLPRNDIAISMTFGIDETTAPTTCTPPQTGTPPNCVDPVATAPNLTTRLVGAKKIKSGKALKLTAVVKNTGNGPTTDATVTLKSSKSLVKGKAKVAKAISAIVGGGSARVTFTVKTKPGKAGKKLKSTLDTAYTATAGAAKTHNKTGHVTLMK